MEPQESIAPESAKPEPIVNSGRAKNLAIFALLAVLAVIGLGFGGFEFWQNTKKDSEIKDLKAKISQSTQDTPTNGGGQSGTEITGGAITITVKANYDTVELTECLAESEPCINGTGYTRIVMDSEVYAWGDAIRFMRDNTSFGGVVFEDSVEREFSLDGTVVQIVVGHFGNGGDEAIIFLMEDGTVSAIRLNSDYSDFEAVQSLEGISGATKLYKGYEDNGSSVFAVLEDGSAVSLYHKIWTQE